MRAAVQLTQHRYGSLGAVVLYFCRSGFFEDCDQRVSHIFLSGHKQIHVIVFCQLLHDPSHMFLLNRRNLNIPIFLIEMNRHVFVFDPIKFFRMQSVQQCTLELIVRFESRWCGSCIFLRLD